MRCSVAWCPSSKEHSYFTYPKDDNRRAIWIKNCRTEHLRFINSRPGLYRVCGAHFEDKMFLNRRTKGRLVYNAVPTLFNYVIRHDFPNPRRDIESRDTWMKIGNKGPCSVYGKKYYNCSLYFSTNGTSTSTKGLNANASSSINLPTKDSVQYKRAGQIKLDTIGPIVPSNVITISKQMAQDVVNSNSHQTILPENKQILNVNALWPQNSQGGVNKNVSRVMILQKDGGRLRTPTENGQFQLLRGSLAPGQGNITLKNAKFRIQSVPSVSTHKPWNEGIQFQSHVSIADTPTTSTQAIALPQQAQQKIQQYNKKEKCHIFLARLYELSSKEPKSVERVIRNLIQELVDATVEPEQFCDRLEKLLNVPHQPCIIGFLKESLPLLRQSLVLKELVIDGIRPPQN